VFGGVIERHDQAFTATSATMFMDNLTPELLPNLSKIALLFLRLLPKKRQTAIAHSNLK
jgi:hypothetical protein